MNPKTIAIAATTFACAALLSVSWSDQRGVSLSVQSAQAAHAKSAQMSRHSRGHMARMSRGYSRGPNPVEAGANIATGAVNTAGALAFGALDTAGAIATAPFGGPGWNDGGWNDGYYASSTWGDYDCRYGAAGCRPYAEKWAQSGPTYLGGGRDISRPGGRGVSRKAAN
jgi:hypothetical protein